MVTRVQFPGKAVSTVVASNCAGRRAGPALIVEAAAARRQIALPGLVRQRLGDLRRELAVPGGAGRIESQPQHGGEAEETEAQDANGKGGFNQAEAQSGLSR